MFRSPDAWCIETRTMQLLLMITLFHVHLRMLGLQLAERLQKVSRCVCWLFDLLMSWKTNRKMSRNCTCGCVFFDWPKSLENQQKMS